MPPFRGERLIQGQGELTGDSRRRFHTLRQGHGEKRLPSKRKVRVFTGVDLVTGDQVFIPVAKLPGHVTASDHPHHPLRRVGRLMESPHVSIYHRGPSLTTVRKHGASRSFVNVEKGWIGAGGDGIAPPKPNMVEVFRQRGGHGKGPGIRGILFHR